ncbi:hypothetical protein EJV46_00300 [Roseococcus sp. SYP-B2431]|uniref:hypothetical protein n=1 Tax=Roseococcus sp. SYP-B2431 TaxID=2496640 RepID=UPI00103B0649|nr:hypothetical protein [Roseococcus sp. SYP-B2431]TCI00933.1 hypothetical protein EJV46_00300 [Roseococcus sp. SYP-B2431]
MDPELPATTPPAEITHPEEMKASVTLRLGPASVTAAARTMPAGLVTAGILVSAILLSLVPLVRAARSSER